MKAKPPRVPNDRLRQARIGRGWSQEDVAERLGTNGFTISRWELGQAVPSPYYRQRLSDLFAQPLAALGFLPEQAKATESAHPSHTPGTTSATPLASVDVTHKTALYPLPPRPRSFLGRGEALQIVLRALKERTSGQLYTISGMPGIGKSALAAEVLHHLSSEAACFPDGILSLSGHRHQGEMSLRVILEDVLTSFGAARSTQAYPSLESLGRRVHTLLTGKRILVLMDDLDPTFPLALARRFLVARRVHQMQDLVGCTLLITSRLVPAPGLVEGHLALGPLDPEVAVELLALLVGSPFHAEEQEAARQLCALVGYVPGAIEWIAHALSLGLSASWLVTHFRQFSQARQDKAGPHARTAQAVAALPTDLQERLAWLAPLGTRPFRVEEATLMHLPEAIWTTVALEDAPGSFPPLAAPPLQGGVEESARLRHLAAPILAATAADLLQLAEQSLLVPEYPASNRFRMPPLLQAVAADLERQQYAEALALAQAHSRSLPGARWQQVFSALAHAWSSDNHAHVVELAYSLHRMATRLPVRLGEQVLRWGIAASQALHDSYYLVRFLTRLGKLLLYRGDFITTQALWQEATSLTQAMFRQATSDRVLQLLIPWSNLTLIPGLQDEHEEAERRVQRLLRQSEDVGAAEDIAAAYNKLAFYRRLQGKADQAARAGETAHTLARGQDWSPGMLAEIALEQARLAGAYEQTTQVLKTLLTTPLDPQAEADLVYDQALYALNQGHRDEAYAYAQQSLKLAQHARTPVIARRGQELLGRLASA